MSYLNLFKTIFLLTSISSTCMIAQSSSSFLTIFDHNKTATFIITDVTVNGPSGDDSLSMEVSIERLNEKYIYNITHISGKAFLLYRENFIYSHPISLIIENGVGKIASDCNELFNQIHEDKVLQYGKDTANFGEYFTMMCLPKVYTEAYFEKYFNVIAGFIDQQHQTKRNPVFTTSMGDTIPAEESKTVNVKNGELEVISDITLDSVKVRNYLYRKAIEKSGESLREYMKESDMVYVPSQTKKIARAKKDNVTGTFILENIWFEHRENYSRGQSPDMVNTIRIDRK